jgi:hypothetical protein
MQLQVLELEAASKVDHLKVRTRTKNETVYDVMFC